MPFWNSAFGLLLVTGTMLGLCLPLGKLATGAGVPAVIWAVVISLGAGGALAGALLAARRKVALNAHFLRYCGLSGAFSYALPNLLLFATVHRLGAGYTGLMYTLSPLFTLAFAAMFGLQRPSRLGIAGLLVGFAGALLVAWSRFDGNGSVDPLWIGIALLIPVLLAAGNVYRTLDWPSGAGPIELAAGSHLIAAAILLVGIAATGRLGDFATLGEVPVVTLAQMGSAALMFAFFFRLQLVGGPVYLSQIGYVAAAAGLASGTLVLGESYGMLTWAGAAIIAAGVAMTTRAQRPAG